MNQKKVALAKIDFVNPKTEDWKGADMSLNAGESHTISSPLKHCHNKWSG